MDPVPSEVLEHYARSGEAERLSKGAGPLERARTEELLARSLPPAPARVLDVGGGAGAYALGLAARGYEVHLVDPVPLHVEQARRASAAQPERPLASARLGHAGELSEPDGSVDAVLLLGPLYHLTERASRLAALSEARRVLRPAGVVCAVGISRFASLLDGLFRRVLEDPSFHAIVARDLREGQHRNPTPRDDYFTTAFFHHPAELDAEIRESGFVGGEVIAVEGPAWLLPDFGAQWEARGPLILEAVRAVEREPALLGVSAHLMAVARRP